MERTSRSGRETCDGMIGISRAVGRLTPFVTAQRGISRTGSWMRRREAMRFISIAILVWGALGACAERKPGLAPALPQRAPKTRPAKKQSPPSAPTMPPPQVGYGQEDHLREEAKDKVEAAERILRQIDKKTLEREQEDTFLTIQSFLVKAKEAFSARDFLMAFTLADKATILGEDLLNALPR